MSNPSISVADALLTGTQQRVLALLYGQADRSFFTKELIDLAGVGSGAVQRELSRMLRSGLVVQSLVGNQKHYRANGESPVFYELKSLVDKLLGVPGILAESLRPLADKIHWAMLYGSIAKGRAAASGDIDVLVVSDSLTLEDVYGSVASAEKRLGRAISPMLYSSAELRRRVEASQPFLTKVLAGDFITLLGGMDDLIATGQSGSRRPTQGRATSTGRA
ncbi:transcriptional regulator [Luteibacter sp. 22Crub2.1]|uniref:transcriptional regulator n=1 Tax=Luteibacter sp. 22Crub2.1 TaxID=1283288 RepID=UPI0009CC5964|nr:transcriptional regulator [Luteibacter sp. 22Crub2.1]SKB97490.1 hypothetical protein SAMN05660880_03544 [Luteibacter sp. 22Crub2.1]